ncbi:M48 family metallopeptidase [Nesterenkonia sp. F]
MPSSSSSSSSPSRGRPRTGGGSRPGQKSSQTRRETEQIEVDGHPVIVVRSSRRTRTVSADQVDGVLRLRVPMRLGRRQVDGHARAFRRKLERRAARSERTEDELMQRAHQLVEEHFGGLLDPDEVRSVTWSDRQNTLWGSTTALEGTIRLSSRLSGMPRWVQDSVLIHELAHLIEPDHGPEFQRLVAAYPHTVAADAFLEGVSYGWRNPQD